MVNTPFESAQMDINFAILLFMSVNMVQYFHTLRVKRKAKF